ncbi:MAG TPA: ATP-binding protein [Casimicrobiaceae bacterium]
MNDALRAAVEFGRSIIESSRDCIKVLDLQGRLLSMSRTGQRLLGIEDLTPYLDKPYADFWHGEERQAVLAAMEEARRGGTGTFVGFLPAIDGTSHWWEVQVTPIVGKDGAPDRLLAVSRDITERWNARRELEAERRGLAILNAAALRLASNLDRRAIVQAVTDAATELCHAQFGAFFLNTGPREGDAYDLYTLSGAASDAFSSLGLPRKTPLFEATFTDQAIVRSDDITRDPRYGRLAPHHGLPDGHPPVRSYLAVPVVSRAGGGLGALFFGHREPGVFSERAERLVAGMAAHAAIAIDNARLYESERRARAEAERMSDLKDEFLATLSHELRTPLGAIIGWAHVIASRPMEPADLQRVVGIIDRNARAQTQLIEDLLDMSRISAGKLRLDIQSLQPAMVIEAALETVRPAAEAKGIRLDVVLDPDAGPVSGDPSRVQQVVWNVLSNAVKFTPKQGRIQVILRRVDSHVEITVADTGVGIEADFLPHVFDRFRQADGTTTRRQAGLGLGLSIAKNLVELHGGTIRAASAGKGCGATFSIMLPVTAVHPVMRAEAPSPPAPAESDDGPVMPDLSGVRVLAIDDHADGRELIRRVLEDCGAHVVTAGSVDEALALVPRERPDVVVSDIGMPEADGFDLMRRLRAIGLGDIPAIALTAFARAQDRMRILRAGFRWHLAKPVEPLELCVVVANIAGRSV